MYPRILKYDRASQMLSEFINTEEGIDEFRLQYENKFNF